MKKLLFFAVFCLSVSLVQAQGFDKGTKNLNVGVGYGYGLGANASLDYGVSDLISVGAMAGFSRRSYFGYGYNYLVLGGRGAVHFGKFLEEPLGMDADKFDPYVGLTGGFRRVSYTDGYVGYSGAGTGVMLGGYVGLRYQLKGSLGVYAELGSPFSTVGITLKF
ncbi:hypothetical protein GVN16_11260 [Emticicia sp. CRIBPO]|uniref:hypothetical protein n=1 Tax=Emticicia sp. CRIBPO TaxID=2683258 RepID=UPI001412A923|nr:hypothetical protein [Emticicia sp. CRIBPO]NBA86345.1 hypothetical protein [Emticicia sp. CRIBPO]